MMPSYEYFDINANVAVIAKELANAIDEEAKKNNDHTYPGSRFRHARDPEGDWDMSICTSYDSAFSDPMLMSPAACFNLAKACGVNAPEQFHHNAGIDARESLASVVKMMFYYPGVGAPKPGPQMPILAAVDLLVHWKSFPSVTLC